MAPMLERLADHCRVLSYSLAGEPGSGLAPPDGRFDRFITQLDGVLDHAGVATATLCGVSYGGFIALRYAATRAERVEGLVLVSSPPPGWVPSPEQQRHLAHPVRNLPLFAAGAAGRLWHEVRWALPDWPARLRFAAAQTARVVGAPMAPGATAARVAMQQAEDFTVDCHRVRAPVLVVTGDDDLDRVVPPPATRQYLRLIPGSRYEPLPRTGHFGLLTRVDRFVEVVSDFAHANDH
jgi:3-oxoadipate enol-lactonase